MKTFFEYTQENYNENWRSWAAGAAALVSSGVMPAYAEKPPMMATQQDEIPLVKNDPRKPTIKIVKNEITIKFLAGSGKLISHKQILDKYINIAQDPEGSFKVKFGALKTKESKDGYLIYKFETSF